MTLARYTTTVPRLRAWLIEQTRRNRDMVPYSWLPFDLDLIARRCAYCDRILVLREDPNAADHITDDHVVPRSQGGLRRDNLVVVCRQCNSDKAVMLWLAFLLKYPLGCRGGLRSGEIGLVDRIENDRKRARRARKRKRDNERRKLRRIADPNNTSAHDFRVEKLLSDQRWHNTAWPWD